MCVGIHIVMHRWRSEDNLQQWILSYPRVPRTELASLGLDQHLYPFCHLAGLRTFLCVWPMYMIMCIHMHVQTRSHAKGHRCHCCPLPPPPPALQLVLLRPGPSLHLELTEPAGRDGWQTPGSTCLHCSVMPCCTSWGPHMMYLALNWPSHLPNQDILRGTNVVMVRMKMHSHRLIYLHAWSPSDELFGRIRCGLIGGGTLQD